MFKSQLSSMGIDTKKMPLGDISQQTVDEGFKVIPARLRALAKQSPADHLD